MTRQNLPAMPRSHLKSSRISPLRRKVALKGSIYLARSAWSPETGVAAGECASRFLGWRHARAVGQ